MTTIDAIELAVLTVVFGAFAATMAWAETLARRRTGVHAPADKSRVRSRYPF